MKYDRSTGFWKRESFWKIAAIASVAISIPIAGIQHGTEQQREWGKLGAFSVLTGIAASYACTQKHLPNEWEEEIRKRLQLLEEEEERLKNELTEIEIAQHKLDEDENLIAAKWESIKQAESNIDGVISERLELATVEKMKHLQDWENRLVKEQTAFEINSQRAVDEINEELKEKQQQLINERTELEEKHQKVVEIYKQKVAEQSELIHLLDAPKFPTKREIMAEVYCSDFIKACLRWEKRIKADCYDRQPMDDGKSHNFWLKLRDNSLAAELKTEEFRNWVALQCKFPVTPFVIFHPSEGTIEIQIPHNIRAYKAPKEYQIATTANEVKGYMLKPGNTLPKFVTQQNHVCGWGSTGEGKSTLIANTIGAMAQSMGDGVEIITTIPKMDEGIRELFPSINYLGFRKSIFGLLEAATELVYRNKLDIEAYENGETVGGWDKLIYFFDEYSEIASRWNSCNKEEFEEIIEQFKATLDDARRRVFEDEIEGELKYSSFANRLLLFCWRVGRALGVKVFIFGQNLMPKTLKVNKVDLENASFICMPTCVDFGVGYRVKETEINMVNSQYEKIGEILDTDPNLKYHALFIPTSGKPYFAQLPAPNTYEVPCEQSKTVRTSSQSSHENTPKTSNLPKSENIDTEQVSPLFDDLAKINSKCRIQAQKLDIEAWRELPKTLKGKIKKTEVYKLLGVRQSKQQKLVSQYIDWLEETYNS
ncbi:MAG: hypothetical protein AAF378_05135 [Cyanobacteria bacterium P01_A01_bin.84]